MAGLTFLRFGIRGKIALLVVVAAAMAAYLVAKLLARSAEELLHSHELVDLGDEAMLRGWEIADRLDGLREDTLSMKFDSEFQSALLSGATDEELSVMAEKLSRRYWSRYLRVDIVPRDADSRIRVIEANGGPADEADLWMPEPGDLGGLSGQRTLKVSEIRRVRIRRTDPETGLTIEGWEPVVWACASLPRMDDADTAPPPVLRVLMSLNSAQSPRHLFALISPSGELLVKPEEHAGEGDPINDALFEAIGQNEEVRDGLLPWQDREVANELPISEREQPQVRRVKLFTYQPLQATYWFLEGLPGPALRDAIASDDEVEVNRFFEDLRQRFALLGRVGGVGGGGRELRLLAPDRVRLDQLRSELEKGLADRYGKDVAQVSWRRPVNCDEAHAWAIRLDLGGLSEGAGYLIVYAVLDDELASSIQQEMAKLKQFSFGIAVLAGAIAFMISMFFVRPLQRMTQTAQRVSEADPDRLPTQLRRLVDHLPVNRSDEVGDIARASKRLFEEVLESQEKLENRVRERTAKLAQANLDLEEANEQLKSLSREKDSFVAKVSHDLRQPLNAIFLQVEALKLSALDEQQAKDVQRIHDHALRELNLVNDILEYQKIIMGAESLRREEIEVRLLLAEMEEAYGPGASKKGITFLTTIDDGAERFEADRRRLRQILDNLVSNACKFTTSGSVTVAVRPRRVAEEDWIEFAVSDTGRGMKPEEQARAFVPFVSNKKGNESGTGLGLSICRELCAQMAGRIGFISEPDLGTTFTVMLPRHPRGGRYDSVDTGPEVVTAATDGPGVSSGRREGDGALVLVVDDDPSVRSLMKRNLEGEGYRVICAADVDEGLELARTRKPHAITLDIVMPGADGWEMLAALKSSPSTESIPVIMVSMMADRSDAVALGVEDCLVKPVDQARLSRVVRRVTAKSRGRRLLVVDDDASARETLCRLLADQGWEPVEASNGGEAIASLKEFRPAAVILDLVMPGVDGFEFLVEQARHPDWRDIPVMVLTGVSPTPDETVFLRRRVGEVIEKGDSSAQKVIACLRAKLGG